MVIRFPFGQQQKNGGSFVKLPSSKVINLCNSTLSWIQKSKERDLKELIESERSQIVNGFWHKLFKKPVPTDEDVLNSINSAGKGDYYLIPETYWIEFRYSRTEEIAKKLLNAASQADEVYISTEDLEFIS